ncbi:MAG: hypothetical protein AAGG44_20865, partial [Planctomycetota bacterium]
LASAFLERQLVTDIVVTQVPLQLGKGKPLFARHHLEDLQPHSQREIQKSGFRIVEMEIRNS